MEFLAALGAIVVFFGCALALLYYFGGASFTFENEMTGKKKVFKREGKK